MSDWLGWLLVGGLCLLFVFLVGTALVILCRWEA